MSAVEAPKVIDWLKQAKDQLSALERLHSSATPEEGEWVEVPNEETSVANETEAERLGLRLAWLDHLDATAEMAAARMRLDALERIGLYEERERGRVAGERALLRHALGSWCLGVVAANGKAPKSLSLPSTSIVTTAGRDKIEVVDEAALIQWDLRQFGRDYVRYPAPVAPAPSPDKKAMARAIAAKDLIAKADKHGNVVLFDRRGGEMVPGVLVQRGERTVEVRTGDKR